MHSALRNYSAMPEHQKEKNRKFANSFIKHLLYLQPNYIYSIYSHEYRFFKYETLKRALYPWQYQRP